MGKSSKRALESAAATAPSSDVAPMEVDTAVAVDEVEAPKSKKSKKDKDGESDVKEIPKEAISAIAKPLAGKKLNKHVLKLVKKGTLRFGLSNGGEHRADLFFFGVELECDGRTVELDTDGVFAWLGSFQIETSETRS